MNTQPENERAIAETALLNLEANMGIYGRWNGRSTGSRSQIDGELSLVIGSVEHTFKAEVKREFREYHLEMLFRQAQENQPFMVIAERLSPSIKKRLREQKVAYLDIAGNIHADLGNGLLWIEGQKPVHLPFENTKTNRAFTKAGLRVVFHFLLNPTAVNDSYRKIAAGAGVALGTINEAMSALKEEGYLVAVNKERMILNKKKQLLENWMMGYQNILKPSLFLGAYYFRPFQDWKSSPLPPTAVWGGEPAGDIQTGFLNPEQWTVYTGEPKTELLGLLRLVPKKDGNIRIYKRFWTDQSSASNATVTPELLTYTDLMLTEDPRCIETAQMIYEQKLSKIIEQQ